MSDIGAVLGIFKAVKRTLMADSFEGLILDLKGQPIQGAIVHFDTACSTPSALSGRFSVDLKMGTYSVSVQFKDSIVTDIDRLVINTSTNELNTITVDRSLFSSSSIDKVTQEKDKNEEIKIVSSDSTITPDSTTKVTPNQPSPLQSDQLSITIQGVNVQGSTVSEFYINCLRFILEKDLMKESLLPWSTSEKRYLIAKEPIHPTGKGFTRACEVDGIYIECNKSKDRAQKDMNKFVHKLLTK
jgi:hypothetical protein